MYINCIVKKTTSTWLIFAVAFAALYVMPLFASASSPEQDEQQQEYIAVVNGKKISMQDLKRDMDLIKNRYAGMGFSLQGPQLDELKKDVLNKMIEKEILFQESEKQKITISSDMIELEIDNIRDRLPEHVNFEEHMHNMGYNLDFLRNEIRVNLAIAKLIEKEIGEKVDISDEEIKSFYKSNTENFRQPEQVRAKHILVEDETGGKEKIENILSEIQKGGDFKELAKKHSGCPSGENGGDLGYFSRGQMVDPFEKAAFDLEIGEISDVVETTFGYHVIKLEDRRRETIRPLDEVRDEITHELKRHKVAEQIPDYITSLKQKYPVEINMPDAQQGANK